MSDEPIQNLAGNLIDAVCERAVSDGRRLGCYGAMIYALSRAWSSELQAEYGMSQDVADLAAFVPDATRAAAPAWIACAERMPAKTGDVLCWADGWKDPMILTRYTGHGGDSWLDPESTCPVDLRHWPTHWMPLPAAPEAGA
jgi:hypothetical protein